MPVLKTSEKISALLPTGVSRDDIEQQMEKILESKTFAGATRSQDFLRFTLSKLLEGQVNEIKEYTIGVEVFGKQATFDPGCTPIVRVEAARLRKRLHAYQKTEGWGDAIIIELPKGAYVPAVRKVPNDLVHDIRGSEINEKTLGVLPILIFDNAEDTEAFSKLFNEELIRQLRQVTGLTIRPITTVLRAFQLQDHIHAVNTPLAIDLLLQTGISRIDLGVHIKMCLIDLSRDINRPVVSLEEIIQHPATSRLSIISSVVSALKLTLTHPENDLLAFQEPILLPQL